MTDEKKIYTVGEVPTQVAQVVVTPDGKVMEDKEWQAAVMNKLDKIISVLK